MSKTYKDVIDLLSFLDGSTPPVFEERGQYDAQDAGVFDLSTAQGRAAWKANAPETSSRIVLEDGNEWVESLMETLREAVEGWLDLNAQ